MTTKSNLGREIRIKEVVSNFHQPLTPFLSCKKDCVKNFFYFFRRQGGKRSSGGQEEQMGQRTTPRLGFTVFSRADMTLKMMFYSWRGRGGGE